MSKRLFLATSFSGRLNYETGQVLPEFRTEIEELLIVLRKLNGLVVFCAIEHEGWMISAKSPDAGVAEDLHQIEKSDALLALLIDEPSEGLQYEMGYAAGQAKKVIAASTGQVNLGYFNQGLADLGKITHIFYDSPEQLADKIGQLLKL